MIFVTGGAGFIGANFILDWIAARSESVVNLDKLTPAISRIWPHSRAIHGTSLYVAT
jgi:dTDP-D-glucose 4,6-dehydratase